MVGISCTSGVGLVVVTTPAVRLRNGAPAVLQVAVKQVASFPPTRGTMPLAKFSGAEKPKPKACVPVKSAGGAAVTKTRRLNGVLRPGLRNR